MSPHRQILVDLVRNRRWRAGAELGVDKGVLFNMLLSGCPELARLVGVDTCPVPKRRAHCESIVEDFPDRAELLVMTTHEAAAHVPDGSLDFVFIDADHSYEAVADDISCWRPKVRVGGWLGGHDYNRHFPGVIKAVDRAFGRRATTGRGGSIWEVWV